MRRLHETQVEVLRRVRRRGGALTPAMRKIIDALDTWFDEHPQGPSRNELISMTGLSHGAIWLYLPVLEDQGYVRIVRNRHGRARKNGVILMRGLDDEGA